MMFATLDDLEGTIELIVFEKTLAEYEAALAVDEVVLVRGRVDHKDKDKTTIIVQTAERSARPTSRSRPRARPPAWRHRPRAGQADPRRQPVRRPDHRRAQARLRVLPGGERGRPRHPHRRRRAHAAPGPGLPGGADAVAARRAGQHPRALGAAGAAGPGRRLAAAPAAGPADEMTVRVRDLSAAADGAHPQLAGRALGPQPRGPARRQAGLAQALPVGSETSTSPPLAWSATRAATLTSTPR